MSKVFRFSWVSAVLWVSLLVLSLLVMPDIGQLVREKGQATVGSSYSYTIANNILKKLDSDSGPDVNKIDVALVYVNPNKLTDLDKMNIKARLGVVKQDTDTYHILSTLNPLDNPDMSEMLISKDETTLLVSLSVDKAGRSVDTITNGIRDAMKIDGLELYTTGSDLVQEDFVKTTENGIEKTELITIIFIFIVLLLIFRSPVTPFVTLLSVGLSFVVSLNLVLNLVTWFNFPISNFSKVFLILILFGIGTDYSLLLLMQFKRELSDGVEKKQAIINTYKTAGKTVLMSSLTILIGFTSLFFVKFGIYRSAVAIAIGVAILLMVLFSFVPTLMYWLGKYLFWSPFRTEGHTDSKLWRRVTSFSIKYPIVTLAITLAFCGLIFFYNENLSFNSLSEVDPSYSSITGNNVATDHFGMGQTLPATLAFQSDQPLDDQETLATIDKVTEAIKAINGVDKVYSVTQPKGQKIDTFYISDQSNYIGSGLVDAEGGLNTIHSGLQTAIDKINGRDDVEGSMEQLQNGADSLVTALDKLHDGNEDLIDGTDAALDGVDEISGGIASVDKNLGTIVTSLNTIQASYTSLYNGYQTIDTNMQAALTSMRTMKGYLDTVVGLQATLAGYSYGGSTLGADPTFATMQATTSAVDSGLGTLITSMTALESGLATANANMSLVNSGLSQAKSGVEQIKAGTDELSTGGSSLSTGLHDILNGEVKLLNGTNDISKGAKDLRDGQNQLVDGMNEIQNQLTVLGTNLKTANSGVSEISDGLDQASEFLNKLSGSHLSQKMFYIPEEDIHGVEFARATDIYFSKDKKEVKMMVILKVDPYTQQAMDVLKQINHVVDLNIKNSKLSDAKWGIAGITEMNLDLQSMSDDDFLFAKIIMLISIFLILLLITRDFWMSLFINMSLIAAYYIAFSLSGLIFGKLFNMGLLSWTVPFTSFIMLVTLGVDYSIFLIMREKENKGLSENDSIIEASYRIGSVIISAGLILSGTFAAMLPSGVKTLMEVSVTVMIGIMLLCILFIPVFIPTMVSIKTSLSKKENPYLEVQDAFMRNL